MNRNDLGIFVAATHITTKLILLLAAFTSLLSLIPPISSEAAVVCPENYSYIEAENICQLTEIVPKVCPDATQTPDAEGLCPSQTEQTTAALCPDGYAGPDAGGNCVAVVSGSDAIVRRVTYFIGVSGCNQLTPVPPFNSIIDGYQFIDIIGGEQNCSSGGVSADRVAFDGLFVRPAIAGNFQVLSVCGNASWPSPVGFNVLGQIGTGTCSGEQVSYQYLAVSNAFAPHVQLACSANPPVGFTRITDVGFGEASPACGGSMRQLYMQNSFTPPAGSVVNGVLPGTCPAGFTLTNNICTSVSTTVTSAICPAGNPEYLSLNATQCQRIFQAQPSGYIIEQGDVQNGTCIPDIINNSGEETTCTFTLSGAPDGISYVLPEGGITSTISTTTRTSERCVLSGDTLVCTSVSGQDGTVGDQVATTTFGGSADVTLVSSDTAPQNQSNITSSDSNTHPTTNVINSLVRSGGVGKAMFMFNFLTLLILGVMVADSIRQTL